MKVRAFERREYAVSLAEMRSFSAARTCDTEDEIWLVEHEQVFTLGLATKPEHLLSTGNIPCVQTERGGQVTYHGPGQVLAYLLFDLRRSRIMVRDLVCRMESAIIDTLAVYGVLGVRKEGAPGVYVDLPSSLGLDVRSYESIRLPTKQAKIAALGIKVSKGCTFHGLSLNVDMDLQPYSRINPCGFPGLEITDIKRCLSLLGSGQILNCSAHYESERKHITELSFEEQNFNSVNELLLAEVARTLGGTLDRHLTRPQYCQQS